MKFRLGTIIFISAKFEDEETIVGKINKIYDQDKICGIKCKCVGVEWFSPSKILKNYYNKEYGILNCNSTFFKDSYTRVIY